MASRRPENEKLALKQAYAAATSLVRENHRAEFEALYVAEAASRGVTYTPQPTGIDKAREQLQALLTEFPDLKAEIV